MGIRYFPTNFVYWENVEDHEKIKSVLMELVLKLDNEKFKNNNQDKVGGIRNATTSFSFNSANLEKHIDSKIIEKLVWKPLENAIHEIKSTKNIHNIELEDSILHGCWYTKYDKNGSFNMHYHYGNDIIKNGKSYQRTFSLIYILNDKNENNTTLFTIPHGAPLSILPNQQIHFATNFNKEIKEGAVLIFPSSLYHEVLPVQIPGRITIAFNIASIFSDKNAVVIH